MVVGSLVMEELRGLDQVAYVRFASVYREFRDVSQFLDELRPMLAANKSKSAKKTKAQAKKAKKKSASRRGKR